jgi:small redox-active disulfide protein 2
MEIKVLGPGCARCVKQLEEARKAIDEAGVVATLTKVDDITEIAETGVLGTPAVIVDGVIRSSGRLVKAKKIVGWLKEATP